VRFPPFIKKKQLADHIEKHGFGENVIDIEMHCINVSNKRPAGTAKVLIAPFSLNDEFISVLNGSRLLGKHLLSIEPYLERKQRSLKGPSKHFSETRQESQIVEPCIVFVGPLLPNYINKGHIQAHFRECNDAIIGIEFKGNRQRRGCHVMLTFKSSSSATKAIDRYNHTFLLGKHKVKLDYYKPQHPMSSSVSCPTRPVSTSSAMHSPNTKSKQTSSTEKGKISDKIHSSDQLGTHGEVASNVIHHSVGYHSTGQLYSSRPTECDLGVTSTGPGTLGATAAYNERVSDSDYHDSEEDQLQNTATTVIIENLDSSVTQKEIESLTGVAITCYIPSHSTPGKVAAWIEVVNSKYACTIAEKFDGKVIHGKKVHCFITDSNSFSTFKEDQLPSAQSSDSHNRPQQHIENFPTLEDPSRESLHLSQSIPPSSTESFTSDSLAIVLQQHTHSSPTFREPPLEQPTSQPVPDHNNIAQQEYLTLFFLGDQHLLPQPQLTFPHERITPCILPDDPKPPVCEPGPPVPVATL
jgi:hypothetical protein